MSDGNDKSDSSGKSRGNDKSDRCDMGGSNRQQPPPHPHPDPLVAYTEALGAALLGPARAKTRMLAEIRDGLLDATDAYVQEGLPRTEAAHCAVRDFGPVAVLAPECQRELTVAQTRHTACAAALCAPFLLVCWALARTAVGPSATPLALLATVSTLLAAFTLATTGGVLARRFPVPRALPRMVAWTGTGASVGMAVAALTLACTAFMTAQWPLLAPAGALAAVSHAVLSTSARVSRRCLPPAAALSEREPGSLTG
ncbi:permease prefix domain 1-containing protein [Streptomyces smyrnaeus]|uniref:permease prefix domain 1-containing protein n=1 Tax=Streptomyces smyrnaeus TaxID=1387713 RepID=UPI0033AE94DB